MPGVGEQGAGSADSAAYGSISGVPADRHHPQEVDAAQPAGGAEHRDGGHHAGAADQAERRGAHVPREPPPDRAAHLEHVADLGLVGQELRHLAVRQPLDEELDERVVVVRADEYERWAV